MNRLLSPLLALLLPALVRADVVISEIMYHPASERAAEEFVELHNTGAAPISLDGWKFTSGIAFTFPDVSIPPDGYIVVAADHAAFAAKYPDVGNVVTGWSGRLSNGADTLVLTDRRGTRIDQVAYAEDGDWGVRERDDDDNGRRGWRWRSPADGRGKSLELINAAFDNSVGQNWGASTRAEGTPGAPNSIAAADIAPVVTEVRHFPLVPASGQVVTVTAAVRDDHDAAMAVTVSHRVDGESEWSTAPMFDDGAHNDGAAGDNIFGAQLPGAPEGTIVEFFVSATDGRLTRTWPAPVLNNVAPGEPWVPEQSQNCLFQVDGAVYAGVMPLYRLVLKASDRATLAAINLAETGDSHAQFNATFVTIDGTGSDLRYLAGLRNRGHGSANRQPQSFTLHLPRDRSWKGHAALNLNSQYSYLQVVGSMFMRRAGLPAGQSRAVQLRVNNVDPTGGLPEAPSDGFYVSNEAQDSDFVDRHFPNDRSGNLYAVRRQDAPPNQEGDFSHLPVPAAQAGDAYRPVYVKSTNAVEDDWRDLVGLTQALGKGRSTTLLEAPVWETDYVAAVRATVEVDQWMTWFAAEVLIGNGETNLGNGHGDDFAFYIGVADPRARLIPYDLDTILGDGDETTSATADIFGMIRHASSTFAPLTPTPLYPFLRHPSFAPLYFAKLQQLLSGPLAIASVDALLEQTLAGLVPAVKIAERKAWYRARHAYVASVVHARLAVVSGPPLDGPTGLPATRSAVCALTGRSDPARTQRVTVNGAPAIYASWAVESVLAATNSYTMAIGEWSVTDVELRPGINRLLIQAFDASGAEIERTHYDVWYDAGSVASVSGVISGATTWTAAAGPYAVTGPLTVSSGATLTIEAGTTIYLAAGVGITVAAGGRLVAEGTETAPIHFTRAPGSTTLGGTIVINDAAGAAETHFYHTFFDHGGAPAVVCAARSNVVFDYCEWLRNDAPYLHLDGGSFLVSNCIFPSATPGAYFEGVHGNGGPPAGGRAIMRDCFFGKCHSTRGNYNDVIDITGNNRPAPLLQLYNNVFVGSDDDILDLDGTDAWIEGNIFMHVHRAGSPDSASAVSGGSDNGQTSEITIVGNLFFDVDQAVTAKEGNFFTFLNNTVVDQNSRGSEERSEDIVRQPDVFLPAVLNFADDGIPAARGMHVEGNLIHSAERLVRNHTGAEQVTFENNLLPLGLTWTGPGAGNVSAPALLRDVAVDPATGVSNIPTPTKDNYRQVAAQLRLQCGLDPRSPARGTGPNGTDQGGIRPFGVSLSGAPTGTTNATTATITVGTAITGARIPAGAAQFPNGSGWTHYRWRLDGGTWSAETVLATPITLSGVANGPHTLEVVGKNDAGVEQDSADLGGNARMSSVTWTVDATAVPPAPAPLVRLNEVLASNASTLGFGNTFPDLIELTNIGNAPADLGGWGLSDDASVPFKYAFPGGTTLAPGAYLIVYASSSGAVPAPKTGFALGAGGETLTLTRSAAAGGGIADGVSWGQQLPDHSIGRSRDGTWMMCRPTFGSANLPAAQASAKAVKINEWLAQAGRSGGSFIELYNTASLPVDVGGHFLTDNPIGWPRRSPLQPLTFIPAGGFLVFKADNDPEQGPDHVAFRLSALQGEIGFLSPSLALLDYVAYGPQRTDVSEGRSPNGGDALAHMLPTPGAVNPRPGNDRDGDGMPDAWEIAHGFDPLDPAEGVLDADGDGQSNLAEYLAGSDPRNAHDIGTTPSGANRLQSRLIDLSVFARLTQGEILTLGLTLGGSGTRGNKSIVLRAAGPALSQFGVGDVLPDPRLALFRQDDGATVAVNNDWAGDPGLAAAFAQVGAFPFGAATSKDAGIARAVPASASYTVQIRDDGAGSGHVIAELYDATPNCAFTATTPRFTNVSLLKTIAPGTALTVGFVIDGSSDKTVLVRAVGPTLGRPPFGSPAVMADPQLELFDNATGARIFANNDWAGDPVLEGAFAAVGAFPLVAASSRDAALLVTVPPGHYSAQISSADATGGSVLVEIYEVP